MNKAQATVSISQPVQKVFEYTASPENGPMFIPNLNQNANITGTPHQVGQKWNWRFNMVGVDFMGSAEVIKSEAPTAWSLKSTGGIDSTWNFTFEDKGEATNVTLEVEYQIPSGVVGKLTADAVEKINQKTTSEALSHLKTILEG